MPDIPLLLLTIGYLVYTRFISAQPAAGMAHHIFNDLYFNDPLWIASHNFLHSPTALLFYTILLWRFRKQPGSQGHRWLWFVLGCMAHSIVDVLTHYDDGPVLFFPFDWHTRFYSLISYWDKAHYAGLFIYFEIGLNIILLSYLFLPKLLARIKK